MKDTIPWPGDGRAVAARLRAGEIVAVPAEGLVLAHGLSTGAARLPRSSVAIGLASAVEIFDWAPSLRGVALRLARDFWPRPLVLVVASSNGLAARLPGSARALVESDAGVALRLLPQSLAPLAAAIDGPLLIGEWSGNAAADFALAMNPPDASAPPRATVVGVDGREVRMIRPGAIGPDEIDASRRTNILLVCTGNTCRSPMAEVLCRRLLADTLGVRESEAAFEIQSAGLAAEPMSPASPEAVDTVRDRGGDLGRHQSRPLTLEMVDRADFLFTMTAGHLRMLKSLRLPVGPEPEMLSARGQDVPDPIGGPRELYEECADQIWQCLRERLPRILEN